ncbi:MAG: acetate kinase [Flavobacteriales bacterium]|jgi:acetate kinase
MNQSSIKALVKLVAASILCLASFSASAKEEFYRWTDAEGVIHYGTVPPQGVDAVKITTYSTNPTESNTAESNQDKASTASSNEAQKKLREEREAECQAERRRLNTLKTNGARIRMQDEDGTSRYLSTDEVIQEIETSESFLKEACK